VIRMRSTIICIHPIPKEILEIVADHVLSISLTQSYEVSMGYV
jgi:hypothetical protein